MTPEDLAYDQMMLDLQDQWMQDMEEVDPTGTGDGRISFQDWMQRRRQQQPKYQPILEEDDGGDVPF